MKEQVRLTDIFGDNVRTQLLEGLIDLYPESANVTDIVETAGVSRQTWYRHRDILIDMEIIEVDEEKGNSKMYKLREDKHVQAMMELERNNINE